MLDLFKKKISKLVEKITKKTEEIDEEKYDETEETKKEKKIGIVEKLFKKITTKKLSEEDLNPILQEFVSDLIEADVAVEVAERIANSLKNELIGKEIKRGEEKKFVIESLKRNLIDILSLPEISLENLVKKEKPIVVLFLGYNGSGKTTSLAKLGKYLVDSGYSCIFAAADTFRAASLEQIEEHAKNIGVKVIKHKYGADPAAVIYDAIQHAKSKGIDFVLCDSAGRAHTNRNLMEQMKKIIRVNKPHLKILVVDSLTGNDAIIQARMFNEVGIDAIIFTKLDVNEKGGAILSVTHELKKPILFLSMGQKYSDFIKFNAQEFVEKILGV